MTAVFFPGLPADRRLFVPDRFFMVRDSEWVAVSRRDDPGEWERLVADENEALTTRVEDGMWPVSSCSAPWVVRQMIEALRVEPGMRVLEIGTGTGWNAACLAALGCEVVSVEIDRDVADEARGALENAGATGVVVIAGDGEHGASAYAPFDRVIATAAVHTVPYPWVAQTREGGRIVVPYTGRGHRAGMLVLTVADGSATGSIEGEAAFMPLRGQRLRQADLRAVETVPGLRVEVTAEGQRLITA